MANFLGNSVSLMGVPVFYFQNLVTLLIQQSIIQTLFEKETQKLVT
jgi:hypothetical protein